MARPVVGLPTAWAAVFQQVNESERVVEVTMGEHEVLVVLDSALAVQVDVKQLALVQRLGDSGGEVEPRHLLVAHLGVDPDEFGAFQCFDEREGVSDGWKQDIAAGLVWLRLDSEAQVVTLVGDVIAEQVDRFTVSLECGADVLRSVILRAFPSTPHHERFRSELGSKVDVAQHFAEREAPNGAIVGGESSVFEDGRAEQVCGDHGHREPGVSESLLQAVDLLLALSIRRSEGEQVVVVEGEAPCSEFCQTVYGLYGIEVWPRGPAKRVAAVVSNGPEAEREFVVTGRESACRCCHAELHRVFVVDMNISPLTAGRNHTEDVRRHNLSTVLTAVHHTGGMPRSALTELTGVNRSTTAALVTELVAANLVVEAEKDSRDSAGRPSRYVRPSQHPVAIAVNPEVDAVTLGVVGLGGRVLQRARRSTSGQLTVEEAVRTIVSLVKEVDLSGHRVVGVGAAIPGLVRTIDGVVRIAPHLGWVDAPFARLLGDKLGDALGAKVYVANDASLGADAESKFGAGRDISDLVYLNGGASGIGGGIVSGGQPITGTAGYAGEIGHTFVRTGGVACHCGSSGCLETEVRRAPLLELLGLRDDESDQLGAALASSTSTAVLAEVTRQREYLGIALRNTINIFNPQRIVLGGFLAALHMADPGTVEHSIAARPLAASAEALRIVPAQLGSDILLVGAAELAFAGVLADPAGSF